MALLLHSNFFYATLHTTLLVKSGRNLPIPLCHTCMHSFFRNSPQFRRHVFLHLPWASNKPWPTRVSPCWSNFPTHPTEHSAIFPSSPDSMGPSRLRRRTCGGSQNNTSRSACKQVSEEYKSALDSRGITLKGKIIV